MTYEQQCLEELDHALKHGLLFLAHIIKQKIEKSNVDKQLKLL